ncbi:hypothetical protein SAMN04488168_10745 [Bacillus sp. 491mf]|nr:hypothetical protein SAMN04488168_10745 [Bacillus sp. 491mf]
MFIYIQGNLKYDICFGEARASGRVRGFKQRKTVSTGHVVLCIATIYPALTGGKTPTSIFREKQRR